MSGQKRIFTLVFILLVISMSAVGIAITILYNSAFEQQRARLIDTVRVQAAMIKAVAKYDQQSTSAIIETNSGFDAYEATLSQLREAHENINGLGETGEFTVAMRKGDQIIFLLNHRHLDFDTPAPVPISSLNAEPMRLALSGKSGTIIGLDYRGEMVLAAYEPISELGLSIVAKIDLSEIRRPFFKAAGISGGIALMLIFLGGMLILRVGNPMVQSVIASENKLSAHLQNTPIAVIEWNLDFKVVEWNKAAETIFGYTKEEAIGRHAAGLIVSESAREHVNKVWNDLLNYKGGQHSTNENLTRDGQTIMCDWSNTPLVDDSGKLYGVASLARDITDRTRAEEELQRYECIVTSSNDMLALLDKNYVYLAANEKYVSIFGKTRNELIGATVSEIFGETFFKTVIKPNAEKCLQGNNISFQDWFDFPTFGKRFMEINYYPHRNKYDEIRGFIVNGRDITEQKKAEFALKENEQFLHTVINGLPVLVSYLDKDKIYKFANDKYYEWFNKEPKDLLGKDIYAIIPDIANDEFTISVKENIDRALKGEDVECEIDIPRKNRKPLSIFVRYIPHEDSKGNIIGIFVVAEDITDSKTVAEEKTALKAKLFQSEKLASIGQLAAGVAHEINNPMGYISSNLNTMNKYLGKITEYTKQECTTPEIKEDFAEIMADFGDAIAESLEGADRVKRIVTDLKGFSRADSNEKAYFDINKGIESTLNIVWNQLKYHCTVEKDFGELPNTYGVAGQLNQVFMNLLVNAGHATEGKAGLIKIKSWIENDTIFVSVEDNGCGISNENLNKLFDPFFTTKDVGSGTGLGLSLAYDIVNKHNGQIKVHSELEVGTTFTITLPILTKKETTMV